MTQKRRCLNLRQAKTVLPLGEGSVHVFCESRSGMLIGADWSRTEILDLIETADELLVGGPSCMKIKHGLVVVKDGEQSFVESILEDVGG